MNNWIAATVISFIFAQDALAAPISISDQMKLAEEGHRLESMIEAQGDLHFLSEFQDPVMGKRANTYRHVENDARFSAAQCTLKTHINKERNDEGPIDYVSSAALFDARNIDAVPISVFIDQVGGGKVGSAVVSVVPDIYAVVILHDRNVRKDFYLFRKEEEARRFAELLKDVVTLCRGGSGR